MTTTRFASSYRGCNGYVFDSGGRSLRSVSAAATRTQRDLLASRALGRPLRGGRLVRNEIARDDPATLRIEDAAPLLEHERILFVSYPYDQPFAVLRPVALQELGLPTRYVDRHS
jgi:hypothetical protein